MTPVLIALIFSQYTDPIALNTTEWKYYLTHSTSSWSIVRPARLATLQTR